MAGADNKSPGASLMSKIIHVATEFSRAPVGRYISDGPNSGERFRNQLLVPALEKFSAISVDFDGTRPIGSSFLEEAFGGLKRLGYNPTELLQKISIQASDPSVEFEILRYMK